MRWVFGNLNVCRFDGWTELGFKNVEAVSVEQLIPSIYPLVYFTGNFPSEGRLPCGRIVAVNSVVAFRPYVKELSPYSGKHCG